MDRTEAQCLYCDDAANSREHILASGLGGQLVDDALVCGFHNNRCGARCDDILTKQFEFAVHCLDVLKGDRSRGTTWHNLTAQIDGAVISIRPDRTTSLKPIINRDPVSGLPTQIFATERRPLDALQRDLNRLTNPPIPTTSETLREDVLDVRLEVGGPATRGVLKTALHFVAHETADREGARRVAAALAEELFSDGPTPRVRFAPYCVDDRWRGHEFHDVLAWSDEIATLVYVNIFNTVPFLVRLPLVALTVPRRFTQDTRTGAFDVTHVDAPLLRWEDAITDATAETKKEFDERVYRITSVGLNKRYVLAMLERAREDEPAYETLSANARREVLVDAAKRFQGIGPMTPWMADAVRDFAVRRILVEEGQVI